MVVVASRARVLLPCAFWLAAACGGNIGTPPNGTSGGTLGDFASPKGDPLEASTGPVPPPAQKGGYQLGAPVPMADAGTDLDAGGANMPGCATILGVVRDFMAYDSQTGGGHPDFEHFTGSSARTRIVDTLLDTYRKPVYIASGQPAVTTGKEQYDQWYRNVDGINKPYFIDFYLVPNGADVYTFQSLGFFPLDSRGWGNEGVPHNFDFTTEVHTEFVYRGGETFSFSGDDDLWVFVDGKLALDLGGPHSSLTGTIRLDTIAASFALARGQQYHLDLFHAERHRDESNFRIDTNIQFVRCNVLVPDPPR